MESQAQQQAGHNAAGGAAPGVAAPIRLPLPQTAAGADASPASAHGSEDGSAVGEPAPEMSPSGQSPMDRYFEPNDRRWFDPALHTIVFRKTGGMPDGQGLCLMTSPGLPAPRPTAPPASLSPAAALPVDGAASADAPPQPPLQPPASERASQAHFFEEASNYYGGMYGLMPPIERCVAVAARGPRCFKCSGIYEQRWCHGHKRRQFAIGEPWSDD
mmetsp:Transcript_124514/g.398307  ORF Transcript_124514/g.398307 Transcript_124514/m.398307 type:complete len:216 (-) Transcript_124514:366-1013(-)